LIHIIARGGDNTGCWPGARHSKIDALFFDWLPPDPLLLYGPRPEGKSSLLVQIISSLLIIGAFILAIIWLSA